MYICKLCRCLWVKNAPSQSQPEGSWSLYDGNQKPGQCCDNHPGFLYVIEPVELNSRSLPSTPPPDDLATSLRQFAVLGIQRVDKTGVFALCGAAADRIEKHQSHISSLINSNVLLAQALRELLNIKAAWETDGYQSIGRHISAWRNARIALDSVSPNNSLSLGNDPRLRFGAPSKDVGQ